MSKLFTVFRLFLEKRPIVGNSIVYGTLCVAAETSQQLVTKRFLDKNNEPLDKDSITRYAVYGTGIGGPLLAIWYRFLDRKVPGKTMKIVLKKIAIDQFLFTPQLLIVFYISMSILERQSDLLDECKKKFAHTYLANCLFWTPAQAVNFALIPSIYRVTYIGTCSFAWINILCWFKRQQIDDKEKVGA